MGDNKWEKWFFKIYINNMSGNSFKIKVIE